ncbi:MAG: SUMF1/EgtB/PvdO family nonheme iron enzyme [Anaerolineae bacterium]
MPKIFISYRRADSSTLATLLAIMLKDHGVESFVDTRSMDGGGPFPNRLRRAIEDCDVFVCLLGATTLDSEWVRLEIEHANRLNKVLVPVFQERYLAPNPVHNDHILALLQSDGVHILDVRNLYIDAAVASLAQLILNTPPSTIGTPFLASADPKPLTADQSTLIQQLTTATLAILPPPFKWCFVPAGTVTLETNPPKTYTEDDFPIAKYAITNAQYEVFLTAKDGYLAEKDYRWYDFSEEARNYRLQHLKPHPTAFVGDDLPRTNVSWFDTVAFTRWLTSRLQDVGTAFLPSVIVSLPTEQQWQRAALGDDRWNYPWGNEFDESRCCFNVGGPVDVTKYWNGQSVYHVTQLSGNIWEWCLNDYYNPDKLNLDEVSNRRVLRGGSWKDSNRLNLSCTFRHRITTTTWSRSIGFRCVASA